MTTITQTVSYSVEIDLTCELPEGVSPEDVESVSNTWGQLIVTLKDGRVIEGKEYDLEQLHELFKYGDEVDSWGVQV